MENPPRDLSKEDGSESVGVLWYVSDYFSYHQRGQDAAKALTRVFNRLGLDFGILGSLEKCDGDSQRLVGRKGFLKNLLCITMSNFKNMNTAP
ncbi:MAG: hypothetical protein CM1200mP30_01410 [Pseudomonadota bacterium]|nr:MAG: hypothetical protein CM1200mP30_01410 [Pseudomonadota bacterium]